MLVFDCSNSEERPAHRGYGGLKENAVVTILKEYGPTFGLNFTDYVEEADVIFTNDVFPKSVLDINKPKVKRMDGIFWQNGLKDRNLPYIQACEQADFVIFVSNYSYRSLVNLYRHHGKLGRIILNWVDEAIFYPSERRVTIPRNFVAVATSWARPEKRLNDLLWFAHKRMRNRKLYLVGTLPDEISLPDNVQSLGYMSPFRLANTLRDMDGMLNFSYRDAAPKTVAEGICCGLPIFYAGGGGTPELIVDINYGIGFSDEHETSGQFVFEDATPNIHKRYARHAWPIYLSHYPRMRKAVQRRFENKTEQMVQEYIDTLKAAMNAKAAMTTMDGML